MTLNCSFRFSDEVKFVTKCQTFPIVCLPCVCMLPLPAQAAELRKKFLEKKEHFVVTSREALLAACASTDGTLLEEVESLFGYEWPVLVLGWLEKEGLTREMLAALQVDVSQKIAVWSSVYSALG